MFALVIYRYHTSLSTTIWLVKMGVKLGVLGGRSADPAHRKHPAEVVQAPTRMPPGQHPGEVFWVSGLTQATLETLHLSSDLGAPWCTPGRESEVLQTAAPQDLV